MTDNPLKVESDSWHRHPYFNIWHQPIWAKQWASTGTNDKIPEDAPEVCLICGRVKGGNYYFFD